MPDEHFIEGARVKSCLDRKIYRIKELTHSKAVLENEEKNTESTIGASALELFFRPV
jgi:hypothetical protein